MRVFMNSTVANAKRALGAGRRYDLPDDVAQKYIDTRLASEVDENNKILPRRETAALGSRSEKAVLAKPSMK